MSRSWSRPRELFIAARGVPAAAPGTSTLPFKIFTLGFLTKCIRVCFLVAPSSVGSTRPSLPLCFPAANILDFDAEIVITYSTFIHSSYIPGAIPFGTVVLARQNRHFHYG
ncbi:hypothetical protein E2C01_053260 [Portunus trituberculatus]|uniref:Uncharacterized protein n=1 Tax=Portunus trituberculatus TaxID=210409 RepID=A0A5B7GRJ5_PORTR|nr:hypothetical protein [Portunus trituberculatus]